MEDFRSSKKQNDKEVDSSREIKEKKKENTLKKREESTLDFVTFLEKQKLESQEENPGKASLPHFDLELSTLNCFCHHNGLVEASQMEDPKVFDVIQLLGRKITKCSSLHHVEKACNSNSHDPINSDNNDSNNDHSNNDHSAGVKSRVVKDSTTKVTPTPASTSAPVNISKTGTTTTSTNTTLSSITTTSSTTTTAGANNVTEEGKREGSNDVCLRVAVKHPSKTWKHKLENRNPISPVSLTGTLNSRMCIPTKLEAESVDSVANRLHAFLCGFHRQWIGNTGSCKLRRNCAEWRDGEEIMEEEEEEAGKEDDIMGL